MKLATLLLLISAFFGTFAKANDAQELWSLTLEQGPGFLMRDLIPTLKCEILPEKTLITRSILKFIPGGTPKWIVIETKTIATQVAFDARALIDEARNGPLIRRETGFWDGELLRYLASQVNLGNEAEARKDVLLYQADQSPVVIENTSFAAKSLTQIIQKHCKTHSISNSP